MTNLILAIDPGTTESAIVLWDGAKIGCAKILSNDDCLQFVRVQKREVLIACEMIASYGMAVGKSVFETCLHIGRIQEAAYMNCLDGVDFRLVYRMDVKMHHCHSARAKDSNIRQALIDKYGAPGTKKAPGLTYGISSHLWAAFAIATYVSETAVKMGNVMASTESSLITT